MQKRTPEVTNPNTAPVFNFDIERMSTAIDSGTLSFPRKGMSHRERNEWIQSKLSQLDGR